jgi:hypothetical protein
MGAGLMALSSAYFLILFVSLSVAAALSCLLAYYTLMDGSLTHQRPPDDISPVLNKKVTWSFISVHQVSFFQSWVEKGRLTGTIQLFRYIVVSAYSITRIRA